MRGWKEWTSLVVLSLVVPLTLVIGGVSIWFNEEPPLFPFAAKVLITTFAGGMTVLAVAAMVLAYGRRDRVAWAALWAYPAFFVSHVVLFGTYVPDLILAILCGGALALAWPGKPEPGR